MLARATNPSIDVKALARMLRTNRGLVAKADISSVARRLGFAGQSLAAVGDDCAAIKDGGGHLLFAIEGFMNEFVAGDPWFAGWCGVMVNISDVAAMGGRPVAIVDALWADGETNASTILDGLRAASEAYGVPIVGGHSNLRTESAQLSVAILGRAGRLLTSFDARPGDRLVAAIDLRGRYREPFSNWEAATDAPPRTSARAASSAPPRCSLNVPASASPSISAPFRSPMKSLSIAGFPPFRVTAICSRFVRRTSRR
jgi:selenophosphate synthetase-related protein